MSHTIFRITEEARMTNNEETPQDELEQKITEAELEA